jgi:hypothetical protein
MKTTTNGTYNGVITSPSVYTITAGTGGKYTWSVITTVTNDTSVVTAISGAQ